MKEMAWIKRFIFANVYVFAPILRVSGWTQFCGGYKKVQVQYY